jgi:hypothetical protein
MSCAPPLPACPLSKFSAIIPFLIAPLFSDITLADYFYKKLKGRNFTISKTIGTEKE